MYNRKVAGMYHALGVNMLLASEGDKEQVEEFRRTSIEMYVACGKSFAGQVIASFYVAHLETTKEGIKQVSHLKVPAKQAVAASDDTSNVVNNAGGSTTTIGFGSSSVAAAAATTATAAATNKP
jgi:hypothetical protein